MSTSAILGALFLVLAIITTYLMFQYWGYPYDKENRKSSCPQWKMNIHRAFGYSYVLVYLVMMSRMVPRLWNYQVEFPARTVAHICLGMAIGVILLVKISILRWFRHLEEMMPVLGISLLLCTFLLSGLSLPFAFKEQNLAKASMFGEETRARLLNILPETDLGKEAPDLDDLVSAGSLQHGREVLLNKCTHCHDLRTAISRPRTPNDWFRIVNRMASKPAIGVNLSEVDQHRVAAYLVAITPDLQESSKAIRKVDEAQKMTQMALEQGAEASGEAGAGAAGSADDAVASGAAEKAFLSTCSQCHDPEEVEFAPPNSEDRVDTLLERMAKNGMEASSEDLSLIKAYLIDRFVEED